MSALPTIDYVCRYTAAELTAMQNEDLAAQVPRANVTYDPARNDVTLFKVTYDSVIPERNNRLTRASGLLVLPDTSGGSVKLPMVSYQHGTVFGKFDVPSHLENSFETRIMMAQFAGQGYILLAADYFGMGDSDEKDSFMVVDSQTQACDDLLKQVQQFLQTRGILTVPGVFLTGWSQGGVITMALLERYERSGIPVIAVGTASAQCDGFALINQYFNFPREIDAWWLTMLLVLSVFSFETYYSEPGLAAGIFMPDQFELAKRIYNKDPTVSIDEYPTQLKRLIRPEFFDPDFFKASRYGRLMMNHLQPYKWVIRSPVRMHYGDVDECLTIGIAQLPSMYQKAMTNTVVSVVSEGPDADHRITFARAVPHWRAWFNTFI